MPFSGTRIATQSSCPSIKDTERQRLTKVAAEEGGAKAPDVVQRDAVGYAQEARQTERAVCSTSIQTRLEDNCQRLCQRPAQEARNAPVLCPLQRHVAK